MIASLSTYGSINEYGFIETPYRRVEQGRVTETIEYLSAFKEEQYTIAQANAPIDAQGYFINDRVSARKGGDSELVAPGLGGLHGCVTKQLVSVSASLIPFRT